MIIDFYSDWISKLRSNLISEGYAVDPNESSQKVSIKYFNVAKRTILAHPRKVLVSKNLTCPPPLISAYNALKTKIKKGKNLKPHQSKRILDLDYNDILLNDWGIHHFHLGSNVSGNGFVERTGDLLFARVSDKVVHFIDVLPHGSWSKQKLVATIHDEWPENIELYKVRGMMGLNWIPSDQDITQLRSKHMNSFIQTTDGTVYAPLGGGFVASGVSLDAVMASDRYMLIIREFEDYVRANESNFLSIILKNGLQYGNPAKFILYVQEDKAYAIEEHSKFAFFLGKL